MDVPPIVSLRLELVSLSLEGIEALLSGQIAQVEARLELHFAPDASAMSPHVLELRAEQLRRDPLEQPWLLQLLVLRDTNRTVLGRIGFHAPPDAEGMVELGYEIFAPFRGQGYAQEAARAMMDWASSRDGVKKFRASVGPWNAPSLHIVGKLGFVQTGTQIDDVDGEEWVLERRV